MKIDLALLKRIHSCISMESTGCPDVISSKLGISRRYFYDIIDYMKLEFDAPIEYSRIRQTYYYQQEWEFYIGDLKRVKSQLLKDVLETINKNIQQDNYN